MSELKRISAKTAMEVAQHYRVSDEAAQWLAPDISPEQYLDVLTQNNLWADAVKFLAHALPKRLAVWWVCKVAETVTPKDPASLHYQARMAAENWVKNPSEENRRAAEKIGQKTNFSSAASWAAMAAFWCTGSIAAADLPLVSAPPYLYAHAVYGGIGTAAVLPSPEQYQENLMRYFQLGLELARGGTGETNSAAQQVSVA